jgi:septum formation protein
VRVHDVEELGAGPPHEVVAENAYRKAAAASGAASEEGELVLGVDTIVTLGGRIYGKPADLAGARATLRALSGHRHAVLSGICLIDGARVRTAVSTTLVDLRVLDDALLEWYLATGEWAARAGAYAIQGRGAALVRSIEGDYLNVVGLPVATLLELAPEVLGVT